MCVICGGWGIYSGLRGHVAGSSGRLAGVHGEGAGAQRREPATDRPKVRERSRERGGGGTNLAAGESRGGGGRKGMGAGGEWTSSTR